MQSLTGLRANIVDVFWYICLRVKSLDRTSLVVMHAEPMSLLMCQCADEFGGVRTPADEHQAPRVGVSNRRHRMETVERTGSIPHVVNSANSQLDRPQYNTRTGRPHT